MHRPPSFRRPSAPGGSFRTMRDVKHYGGEWPKLSKSILKVCPVCHCDDVKVWTSGHVETHAFAPPGTMRPAVLVDHIRPLNMGGLRLDRRNLQALCTSCHSAKTKAFG